MDVPTIVSLVLNILQAISILWILFFGTKTVLDVAKSKVSRITVISLILALVVLIVATGFYFGLRTSPGEKVVSQPINSVTPTAQPADALTTMSVFCSSIQAHSFGFAYQLYSDNYKKTVSASDFQQKWNISYDSCIPTITSSSDNRTESTLTITEFFSKQTTVYTVILVKNSDHYWRIDSVTP